MSLRIIAGSSVLSERNLSDERYLIQAAQAGDHEAFHHLYETYRDKVYRLIYYSLRDRQQADDVLQTVFLKIYQALPSFRGDSSFLTWIFRITMNACRNANTRGKFWVPLSEIFHKAEEQDSTPSAEVQYLAGDEIRNVRSAVLRLKPKLREVVLLKYDEDLSYEEVASILDISPGTVASRLHRAFKILQADLRKK